MECVPSTYHNCIKYIHSGVVHYVLGDKNPYSHCNYVYFSRETMLASTHYFTSSVVPKRVSIIDIDKEDSSPTLPKGKDHLKYEITIT